MTNGNKPIQSFKAGGVKASIFANANQFNGKTYRVVIDKRYKDSTGNWQSTNSFLATTDLPKAILVMQKAFDYCATLQDAPSDAGGFGKEEDIGG